MKPYWEELLVPRPGLIIKEVEHHYDNLYFEDELGRVWQLRVEIEGPILQCIDHK